MAQQNLSDADTGPVAKSKIQGNFDELYAADTAHTAAADPHPNYVLESSLATVATTGNYADLTGKPTLGTAAATDATAYATAAQGAKADTAAQIAGDLSGTATAPVVAKLNGVAVTGTPTVGQVPVATSGTAATWQTPSGGGGSPGGSSGQVQYNNSGVFGGMNGVSWDDSGRVLTSDNTTHRAWELDAVNKYQRLYNARTDASNGEWAAWRWNSNVLEIGTYKNGTGTARAISFVINAIPKIDLQSGGNVIFWAAPTNWYNGSSSLTVTVQPNGTGGIIAVNAVGQYNFSSTVTATGTADIGFGRNAAGVAEVNSGTAGTLRDLRLRSAIQQPPASITPTSNGDLVFEATNNTTVTIKLCGSDGIVRSGTITLS